MNTGAMKINFRCMSPWIGKDKSRSSTKRRCIKSLVFRPFVQYAHTFPHPMQGISYAKANVYIVCVLSAVKSHYVACAFAYFTYAFRFICIAIMRVLSFCLRCCCERDEGAMKCVSRRLVRFKAKYS
eukprot:5533_1